MLLTKISPRCAVIRVVSQPLVKGHVLIVFSQHSGLSRWNTCTPTIISTVTSNNHMYIITSITTTSRQTQIVSSSFWKIRYLMVADERCLRRLSSLKAKSNLNFCYSFARELKKKKKKKSERPNLKRIQMSFYNQAVLYRHPGGQSVSLSVCYSHPSRRVLNFDVLCDFHARLPSSCCRGRFSLDAFHFCHLL